MRPAEPSFSSPAERFDRAWAATRPAEPSPELLDALWAQASAELDRIDAAGRSASHESLIPIGRRRTRRRRIVVGIALAQAAALLVGVGLAVISRRGEPVVPVVVVPAVQPVQPAGKPMVVVGAEQTLVIRIDDAGDRVYFLDQPSMFPTMADHTSHDFFNALEIAANP